MLHFYLQTQTVEFIKLKQMMFIKIFIKQKFVFIVIIQKIQNIFDPANKKVIGKMKIKSKEK